MLRRTLLWLALVVCLPAVAHAGIFGTSPGDRLLPPPSQYTLPMEYGALDSHIDLQLQYTNFDYSSFGGGMNAAQNYNGMQLAIDGQLSIFDRFQVGLNVPVLNYQSVTFGAGMADSAQFGNLLLKLKAKLIGKSTGPFVLSLFLNTLLPAMTGLDWHSYVAFHGGAGASIGISRITLNAALGVYGAWADVPGGGAGGGSLFLVDLHAALRVLFMAPYLGFQLNTPISEIGGGHTPGAAISAGIKFYLLASYLHFDLGTRVAFNDHGKFYTSQGRAELVFAGGLRF